MNATPDQPDAPAQPDPLYLPPYPPSLPPPPAGAPFAPGAWQSFTRETRPAWLPPALARPPLTAQLVIAATVQFIAAAIMFLIATAALLLSVGVNYRVDLVALVVPTTLCVAHLGCGLLALARKQWAGWAGYALVAIEVFVLAANGR